MDTIPLSVAVPTFVGSLLSAVATAFVLLCYAIIPPPKHFRHSLIISLLIADFTNALDNTISGASVLSRFGESIPPGPLCILNGWTNQITVQAVDFHIIAISIVVLCTINETRFVQEPPLWKSVALCIIVWLPGFTTSFIALGLKLYAPVSGNWCWIRKDRLLLRYVLTHGWRIAIFLASIAIYVVIHWKLYRLYKKIKAAQSDSDDMKVDRVDIEMPEYQPSYRTQSPSHPKNPPPVPPKDLGPTPLKSAPTFASQSTWVTARQPQLQQQKKQETPITSSVAGRRHLEKMLLLNGYPIMYIVLWLPGIANRVVESTAGSAPVWLSALQATTQFVGFANAITYGVNENLMRQIKERYRASIGSYPIPE